MAVQARHRSQRLRRMGYLHAATELDLVAESMERDFDPELDGTELDTEFDGTELDGTDLDAPDPDRVAN